MTGHLTSIELKDVTYHCIDNLGEEIQKLKGDILAPEINKYEWKLDYRIPFSEFELFHYIRRGKHVEVVR